uniref:DUF3456 domain-containing protein n=1 Tax=Esox lucius TaxID=8010 RepID=A0AAY5L0T5_ESOLU
MKMWHPWRSLALCVLLSFLVSHGQGARQSQDLKCGACRAMVDEMEWAISQVDPKKMIQTGSFRINPDGSQSVKEVPLARSEGNLLELMEEVCERMKDYGERVDPTTSRTTYERVTSRDGKSMDLSEAKLDSRVTSSLKYAGSPKLSHFHGNTCTHSNVQGGKMAFLTDSYLYILKMNMGQDRNVVTVIEPLQDKDITRK